jgi:hypothetical protein
MTLKELHSSEIWSNIGRDTLGRNFDATIWKAACEANNATWNLGTILSFPLGPREITEILIELHAKWLLASSPPLNTWTLTSVPIWLLLYLKELYVSVLTGISFCVPTLDEHQTVVYNICEGNACLYAHTVHAYRHTCVCISDCLSIGEFEYIL